MITLKEDTNSIEVHFEGTVKEISQEIWAILNAYRYNLGTKHTLKFIEGYLKSLDDKLIEGKPHD